MDLSQLRVCFIEILKSPNQRGITQIGSHLFDEMAGVAVARHFIAPSQDGASRLGATDQNRVRELFWSLIIQGVIMPGWDSANTNLPFFSVTEYGQTALDSPDPVPHDAEGYLANLRGVAPKLDDVARVYVGEGLDCFARGNYTAAAVMLGVGSEQLTLGLAEALRQALPPSEAAKMQRSIERDKIAQIYATFKKHLFPRITQMPPSLRDGLEIQLDGVFTTIRTHRNEAGHPTGGLLDRLTVLGLFSIFPFYAKRASELIEYLETKPF